MQVLNSPEECERNTMAAGGWTWLQAEANRCGQVVVPVLFSKQRLIFNFASAYIQYPHNHRLISVCVCLQIGIVKRLYLEYPRHKQAGYTVEFTGRDRHGNEFTRPDRQEYVHANLRPAPQQSEQNEERHTPVETPLSSAAETVGETS